MQHQSTTKVVTRCKTKERKTKQAKKKLELYGLFAMFPAVLQIFQIIKIQFSSDYFFSVKMSQLYFDNSLYKKPTDNTERSFNTYKRIDSILKMFVFTDIHVTKVYRILVKRSFIVSCVKQSWVQKYSFINVTRTQII